MADNAQISINPVYSRLSDYSENDFRRPVAKSYTTPTKSLEIVVTAAASPVNVELGTFTTIDALIVTNEDTSANAFLDCFQLLNTVALTCTFTSTTITDDGTTGVMISSGGYAGGTVRITNAVTGGNNTDAIITSLTTDVLTCAAESFTADAADAINLQFLSHCNAIAGAGETVILYDIDPTQDLKVTGTGLVRVRAFGT